MRFIRNVVSKIFRRSSTKKDEQTYINMDEVRKAQFNQLEVSHDERFCAYKGYAFNSRSSFFASNQLGCILRNQNFQRGRAKSKQVGLVLYLSFY